MAEEKLHDEYVAILKDIRLSAEQGKEFLAAEVPLIANELVVVRRIESSVGCVLCGIVLLVAITFYMGIIRLAYSEYKSGKEKADDLAGPLAFVTVVAAVIFILTGGGTASYGLDIAKTVYAPRVVVLEEVGKLLK